MRTQNKNKQKLKYALLIGEQDEYVLDENGDRIIEYVTDDGEIIYRQTGRKELIYSEPVSFLGNISLSGGNTEAVEYGLDMSSYDAVLVVSKNALPITETSYIWHTSEVGYKDIAKTIVDANTADYMVKSVRPSLNENKYILEHLVK